ncbi:hypothetical protein ACFYOK_37560 [Microbispora bryophytorum]|uniref:hypothetical protein n=1 Tax=Microbispora bryophytorum TaxID=1460882 RepID=UPI003405247C
MTEVPAAQETDTYPSTIERAANVPQYVSACSAAAIVTLILSVTIVTGSVIVLVAMVALAMVAGLWGSVYGHRLGWVVMERRVRAADQEAARLRKQVARQEAELSRVGGSVEALATEWDQMYPTVPGYCVRELRELLSIRMEDVR